MATLASRRPLASIIRPTPADCVVVIEAVDMTGMVVRTASMA